MIQIALLIAFYARPRWIPPDWWRHAAFTIDVIIAGAVLAWLDLEN